ncbi:hypothetical protein GCM10023259_052180 [Thermocatellispora tengchongensis]
MPTLASVITASVVSGMISDTAPTKVVFPTPKPPATTIFVDVIPGFGDVPKSGPTEHLSHFAALTRNCPRPILPVLADKDDR